MYARVPQFSPVRQTQSKEPQCWLLLSAVDIAVLMLMLVAMAQQMQTPQPATGARYTHSIQNADIFKAIMPRGHHANEQGRALEAQGIALWSDMNSICLRIENTPA